MTIRDLEPRLKNFKSYGSYCMASCPCSGHKHDDKNQSLSITVGNDGKILMKCHQNAQHTFEEICNALGVNPSELMGDDNAPALPAPKKQPYVWESAQAYLKKQTEYTGGELEAVYCYDYGPYKDGMRKAKIRLPNNKKTFRWYTLREDGKVISGKTNCAHRLYLRGNPNDSFIFLAEGEKDADTIYNLTGYTAVSVEDGAAEGEDPKDKWRREYTEQLENKTVYIVGDNDSTGRAFVKAEAEALSGHANGVYLLDLSIMWPEVGEHEKGDISDAVADIKDNEQARGRFEIMLDQCKLYEPKPKEEPQQAPETALKICKASDYITAGTFDEDINYFKAYRHRKTGFPNIDKYLTLYPGLAALGGASSLGKTTFAVNLVDNLAKGDKDRDPETVLYFTLEQLPIELVTKSLARMMYEEGYKELKNTDIKNGATSEKLEYVKKMYAQKIGCRVHYISCDFRVTAADIISTVKQFMDANQVKPIVVVDYLQLIAPPAGFRGSLRECVDENLKALKAMQKENGLFVLLISSFNRNSNMEPVSYEAFKETSMIEFTCDFVWGLQLTVLDAENDGFYRKQTTGSKNSTADSSVDNKRRMLTRARDAEVKEVEFVSLKSRNAKQVYTAFFQYRPEYDCYTPHDKDHKPDWNAINGETQKREKYNTPNKA